MAVTWKIFGNVKQAAWRAVRNNFLYTCNGQNRKFQNLLEIAPKPQRLVRFVYKKYPWDCNATSACIGYVSASQPLLIPTQFSHFLILARDGLAIYIPLIRELQSKRSQVLCAPTFFIFLWNLSHLLFREEESKHIDVYMVHHVRREPVSLPEGSVNFLVRGKTGAQISACCLPTGVHSRAWVGFSFCIHSQIS